MHERAALAAARAFGIPVGPVQPVRGGPSPLFDATLADGRRIALRLHDPATDPRAIRDGLRLAEALADAGLATPWPQRTRDGALTATVADISASAVQWIAAAPLAPLRPDPASFHACGALLADFHLTADAVAPPDLCLPTRVPALHAHHDPALDHATDAARAALTILGDATQGAILDDPGAVLSNADGLWLIGVDRAGAGWRAQDLAAALWPHVDTPHLPTLRDALVAGYAAGGGSARDASPDRIALCLVLRALRTATGTPQDGATRTRIAALAADLPA